VALDAYEKKKKKEKDGPILIGHPIQRQAQKEKEKKRSPSNGIGLQGLGL